MSEKRWMARAAKALAEVSGHLPDDFSMSSTASHHHDAELTAILALIDSGEIQ
jgi:hypothetical protein